MKILIAIILVSISSLAIAQDRGDEKVVSIKLKSLLERQNKLGTDTIITYQSTSSGNYFFTVIPDNANQKTIDSLSCAHKTSTYVLSVLNGVITMDKLSPCLNFRPLKIIAPNISSILKNGPNRLALSKVKPFEYRDKKDEVFGILVDHSTYVHMTANFKGIKKQMSIDYYNLEKESLGNLNINYSSNLKTLQYRLSEAIIAEIEKGKFQIVN